MTEDSTVKRERNRVDEEYLWGKRKLFQQKKLIDAPGEGNIETGVEEYVWWENLHSADRWYEVAIYHQPLLNKVIQKVVSPKKVSKLNHSLMNKKNQIKFSFLQKNNSRKRKMSSSLVNGHVIK